MEHDQASETEVLLPPWPKRRRVMVALVMIVFILLASSLIGTGLYQIGVDAGAITPPLSRERLIKLLLTDGAFLRAVKQTASQRECSNESIGIKILYHDPLKPTQQSGKEACLTFVAMHYTGADSLIHIQKENASRAKLVGTLSGTFTTAQTEILPGTERETSRITGLLNGIPTTLYVIGLRDGTSWVISYAPTSPTLDTNVEELAKNIRGI